MNATNSLNFLKLESRYIAHFTVYPQKALGPLLITSSNLSNIDPFIALALQSVLQSLTKFFLHKWIKCIPHSWLIVLSFDWKKYIVLEPALGGYQTWNKHKWSWEQTENISYCVWRWLILETWLSLECSFYYWIILRCTTELWLIYIFHWCSS